MPNSIRNALKGGLQGLKRAGAYIARASEGSTWAGISSIVLGAAVAPAPYSYYAIAAGVIGVFATTSKQSEAANVG